MAEPPVATTRVERTRAATCGSSGGGDRDLLVDAGLGVASLRAAAALFEGALLAVAIAQDKKPKLGLVACIRKPLLHRDGLTRAQSPGATPAPT